MKTKILGLLAVGLLAGPMVTNAATLTATPTVEYVSSFAISFVDTNSNGLFDLNELTGFSGVTELISGNEFVSILSVPNIAGISVAAAVAGATLYPEPNLWNFERLGNVNLVWDLAAPPVLWTYAITGLSSVPEPGTLALLGLGLFGLSLSRRRRAN